MISKKELNALLRSTETYRVERTTSTTNMDKFQEAICAFANDLPNSRKCGYLIIGANDDGSLAGLHVDDALLKRIASIRSDGNILPLPVMSVERFEYAEGDLLVAEVQPSLLPPVRYRGRTCIRIGPRRDTATESEERILLERRTAYMPTFDATPCIGSSLDDLNTEYIQSEYLPLAVAPEVLATDNRPLKEKLSALHLYDLTHDCPTFAALVLFGNNPKYYMHGAYVQYVRFEGRDRSGEILNQRMLEGGLFSLLPQLDGFVRDAIITSRPVPVSVLREQMVFNYPNLALRELLMNACMHRDYQANTPIRLYQYDDHIEIMNAGGLYGEARPENFPNVNDYRNPIIAEGMRYMKYVNMFNRGIERVKAMLKENGNDAPTFSVDKITAFEVLVRSVGIEKEEKVTKSVTQSVTKSATKSNAKVNDILVFCASEPKSLTEIIEHIGLKHRNNARKNYINPLLKRGLLLMTMPDKPQSRLQKYYTNTKKHK